jgi:hypothetical protein
MLVLDYINKTLFDRRSSKAFSTYLYSEDIITFLGSGLQKFHFQAC